eukprot:9421841-Karenia_brevis.AAC.1
MASSKRTPFFFIFEKSILGVGRHKGNLIALSIKVVVHRENLTIFTRWSGGTEAGHIVIIIDIRNASNLLCTTTPFPHAG